jgi:hypothetical protein
VDAGSSLFVGTEKGDLHRFEVEIPEREAGALPSSIGTHRGSRTSHIPVNGRKSVSQILPMTALGEVLAVAGDKAVFFSASELKTTREPIKPVEMVCVDETSSQVRVCAIGGTQINIYSCSALATTKDTTHYTPGKPCTMALLQGQVAVGYLKPVREYNLVNTLEMGKVETLPLNPAARANPLLSRTLPDEALFTIAPPSSRSAAPSGNECWGMFIKSSGSPAARATLRWPFAPTHMAPSPPYIVSFGGKDGTMFVHSHASGTLMQREVLGSPVVALTETSCASQAVPDASHHLFVATGKGSGTRIWMIAPVSFGLQATQLVSVGRTALAEELAIILSREYVQRKRREESDKASSDRAASATSYRQYDRYAPAEAAAEEDFDLGLDFEQVLAHADVALPAAVPDPVESSRRSVQLESRMAAASSHREGRCRRRAAELSGVTEADIASQERVRQLDRAAATMLPGPSLDGRRLPKLLRDFHLRAGCTLFLRGEFALSLRHLCLSPLDPREVIGMFLGALHRSDFAYPARFLTPALTHDVASGDRPPGAAALDLGDGASFTSARGSSAPAKIIDVLQGVMKHAEEEVERRLTTDGLRVEVASSMSADIASEGPAFQGLILDDFWGKVEKEASRRSAGIVSSRSRGKADDADSRSAIAAALQDALMMTCDFLLHRRYRPEASWQMLRAKEELDTAICRALALTGRQSVLCAFMARENEVSLQDASLFCKQQRCFHADALLRRSRGLRREALELWSQVGQNEVEDLGIKSMVGARHLPDDILESSSPAEAQRKVALSFTLETLQTSDDIALLFRFSDWVLQLAPTRGLAIFCVPRESSLPHEEVLKHLSREELSGPAIHSEHPDLSTRSLVQRYLLHLVYTLDSKDGRFHTRLAEDLITQVLKLRGEVPRLVTPGAPWAAATASAQSVAEAAWAKATSAPGDPRSLSAEAIRMLEKGGPAGPSRPTPGSEEGQLGEIRGDLNEFLRWSKYYDPTPLLSRVAGTSLMEERVLLHGRARDHDAALRVCLEELADLAGAERYCLLTFRDDPDLHDALSGSDARRSSGAEDWKRNPFVVLFKLLMDSSAKAGTTDSSHAMQMLAVSLMERYTHKVPPKQALQVIPDSISVSAAFTLLGRVLPGSDSRRRRALVTRELSFFEKLSSNVELTHTQRHYGVVKPLDRELIRQPFVLRPPPGDVLQEAREVEPELLSAADRD